MKMRCDHCDGGLGLFTHKSGRLRFCSKAHKKAHEHRLRVEIEEARRKKKRWLNFLVPAMP